MFDVSREEIVGGSLRRVLLVLAGPLVVQNFALVAMEVVDLFWVGRLGGTAVAAVGLAAVVVGLLLVPFVMVFTGTQVVTSQRVGAEDLAAARRVPFTGAAVALVLAAAVAVAVLVGADDVVGLLTDDPAVAAGAASYLTAYAFALFTIAVSDTVEGGFTGWGDTRAALYVNLVAIAVNVVLDPLLILGMGPFPRLELFGAALATGIGYGVGAVFAVALAVRGRNGLRLTGAAIRPDLSAARAILEVGAPIAGQNAGRQLARLVVVAVVSAAGGAAGLAAYHIGSRVATVAFVPAQGLAQAATSVVGQNLGAERPFRARRATWLGVGFAAAALLVVGAGQWLFPVEIARVFVPDLSGTDLALAVAYLQILAYGYWALGAMYAVEAGFNGAGNTTVSMVSTLVQYWAVRVPIAAGGVYLLAADVRVVFWAVTISNVAAALWLTGYFAYSTRRGMLERAAGEGAAAAD
ncbi:putative efflux protein, MATE family [Halomicrobium zhouii]|uniref:Multidrug-efflux transporter n=1 Tax=Halomicrobium zhouii TaxID=767519 RepID=A0A1I6M9B9_9EURY|nr:MATE family efflux transporter [Halomicrobium zhouii]SFS12251.1 putative efflux protein, MATE family [Halomicrobium zhouii]